MLRLPSFQMTNDFFPLVKEQYTRFSRKLVCKFRSTQISWTWLHPDWFSSFSPKPSPVQPVCTFSDRSGKPSLSFQELRSATWPGRQLRHFRFGQTVQSEKCYRQIWFCLSLYLTNRMTSALRWPGRHKVPVRVWQWQCVSLTDQSIFPSLSKHQACCSKALVFPVHSFYFARRSSLVF